MYRVCLLLFALTTLGCGESGPARYPIRGDVTLDGKPLAEGNVYFTIVATGSVETLPVREGKFEGKATAGEHRVEVVAYRMVPVAGEMGGEVPESLIADEFNSKSTLTATVAAAGPNEFKFEVKGK